MKVGFKYLLYTPYFNYYSGGSIISRELSTSRPMGTHPGKFISI